MLEVIVRKPLNSPCGIQVWLPATMTTAIVSPTARPMPRIIADRTPLLAAGSTTKKTLRSCVAPKARLPS